MDSRQSGWQTVCERPAPPHRGLAGELNQCRPWRAGDLVPPGPSQKATPRRQLVIWKGTNL